MAKTREQVQEAIKALVSIGEFSIDNFVYKIKSSTKYTAIATGKRGAEYVIGVCPNAIIIESDELAVYEISRVSRHICFFTVHNNQVVLVQ